MQYTNKMYMGIGCCWNFLGISSKRKSWYQCHLGSWLCNDTFDCTSDQPEQCQWILPKRTLAFKQSVIHESVSLHLQQEGQSPTVNVHCYHPAKGSAWHWLPAL